MTSHTCVSSASRAIALALFLGCSNQHEVGPTSASAGNAHAPLSAASSSGQPTTSEERITRLHSSVATHAHDRGGSAAPELQPAGVTAEWQDDVEQRIAAGEYALT